MRKIHKGSPLAEFTAHLRSYNPRDWDKDIPKELKYAVRVHILHQEQGCQSAYTEKPIRVDQAHVDHFRKQSLFPTLRLEWSNMLVDEHAHFFGADFKDKHIKSKADYDQLLDPVIDQPQQYLEYFVDGEICPRRDIDEKSRQRAELTITVFNLNHQQLKDLRARRIQMISQYKQGGFDAGSTLNALADEGFRSITEFYCQEKYFSLL